MEPATQEQVVTTQREIVDTETRISTALRADPTPELIQHLLYQARVNSASTLSKQSGYLARLMSRPIEDAEVQKAAGVQARIRIWQQQVIAALRLDAAE